VLYNTHPKKSASMPLEIVLGGLLLVAAADFNYFTWWGMLLMVMAQITEQLPVERSTFERVHTLWLCVSMTVSLAMPVMSWLGCTMLANTCTVNGPELYTIGNFLLHYWPSIRAVSMMPLSTPTRITLDAATVSTVFVLVFDPTDTYGCTKLSRWHFMVGAGAVGALMEVCSIQLRLRG
jgi:hypothetical protein